MAKGKPNTQPLWRFLFLIYIVLMLWLLFFRGRGFDPSQNYAHALKSNINLTPFYTIRNYLNIILHYPYAKIFPHCVINLVGNVLMFVPAGWLFPRVFHKMQNFFSFLLACISAIIFVEIIQLFTLLGSFDVDDIILNLCGMILGFVHNKLQK